jgi:hypothetical protein
VLLVVAAYATSFRGDFVLDDVNEIVTNPALRELPPWRAMFVGKTLPARPLPYLSFALNSRVGAANPFGYHVVNLAIHLAAALALCDLVWTSLESPRLRRWHRRRMGDLADGGRARRLVLLAGGEPAEPVALVDGLGGDLAHPRRAAAAAAA